MLRTGWIAFGAGVVLGSASAAAVALAGGVLYGAGDSLGPLAAMTAAAGALATLYDESPKRWVLALFATLVVSSVIVLSNALRGSVDGAMMLAVAVVAVALPIGSDLILSDLGRRLQVSRRLGGTTVATFLVLVVPLTSLVLAGAHRRARTEDEHLLQEVAAKLRHEDDALVVSEIDPAKRTHLENCVAIRSGDQTYRLSDAEFEKEVREYTVRKDRERGGVRRSDVSREAEERMRVILKLQGTELPTDVVLFSHRGPMTIVEKKVAVRKGEGGAS